MSRTTRVDILLAERGLAASRSRAADAVRRGHVRVNGVPVLKPGAMVDPDAHIDVDDPAQAYVSRGALKLIHALDTFGIDPAGLVCLDIGASTGGFTQVLLERGAHLVHAVDVGHDQLAPHLRDDPRVRVYEGLNARDLTADITGGTVDFIVADVSFISVRLALPPALKLAAPGARLVALVKPQFEVGPEGLGKGGLVKSVERGEAALAEIVAWLEAVPGWHVRGTTLSPITGGDGNREYLLAAEYDGMPAAQAEPSD